MARLPFVVLSCFCIHKRDLLHPRVIIASYNPHIGSFLPSLGLVSAPSLRGARSRHCHEIMLTVGHEAPCRLAALACRTESRITLAKAENSRQVSGTSDASKTQLRLTGT